MKKKIGIITYWESNDNYGQQLQCWALQHYLRERGYDAFLIRQHVWPIGPKKGIKRIKQWVKERLADALYYTNLAYNPQVAKLFVFCLDKEACRRQFPRFRKRNLKMSKLYATPEALVANPPKADVYITGSDQVWNYIMPKETLKNFFLQFGDESVKRVAYAPSIGHPEFEDGIKDTIKTFLSKFSSISVRESSAVDVLNCMGYNATHVLDPTMLIPANEYLKLAQGASKRKSIFIYSMNYESKNDIPFDEIKDYAQQKSLPIVVTPGSGYVLAKELFNEVEYCYATIPQWIQLIANAQWVVTASFHGVVLSILMHTPFMYTPLKGTHAESNGRVLDLLYDLGLEQTIWLDHFNPQLNINWESVERKLEQKRKVSVEFLTNCIEL